MDDGQITISDLKKIIERFVQERDWEQFHNPKTGSICLSLEASELLEIFQWCSNDSSWDILESKRDQVRHELADILLWILEMARVCKIDLADSFEEKMKLNAQKYPIEKCKGNTLKYTDL
jgi:dCTP diphosphatase